MNPRKITLRAEEMPSHEICDRQFVAKSNILIESPQVSDMKADNISRKGDMKTDMKS